MREVNSLLKRDSDKYIYISSLQEERNKSIHLFMKCIELGIYIKGFVTIDEKLINSVMFHKKVFDINALSKTDVVFSESVDLEINGCKINGAFKTNSKLLNKKIYIYGAGNYGMIALDYFIEQGISVEAFIDSDSRKQGKYIQNIMVCSPEILKELDENSAILIAVAKCEEVELFIREYNNYSEIFYTNLLSGGKMIVEKTIIDLAGMALHICRVIDKQKVFIWRAGSSADIFAEFYKFLDLDVAGYLSDDKNEIGTEINDWPVWAVEDIIYEDNCYVIIDSILLSQKEIENRCQRLESFGLMCALDFQIAYPFYDHCWYRRQNVLDVNLGWSFKERDNIPGMIHYGSNNPDSFTIATLGGSTTDGSIYPLKSWPEFLCEKLRMDKVAIYNCGVASYATSQELIKLERDVLNLKPNMVISFDGVNDATVGKTPFAFDYLNTIFQYAYNNMANKEKYWDGYWKGKNTDSEQTVFQGVPISKNKFENMMQNLNIINVICQNFGISYHAFIQPNLCGKLNRTPKEEGILICNEYFSRKDVMYFLYECRKLIDNEMNNSQKSWLHDLSAIFDGVNDVYMDLCHVYEKGNKIIADEIWKRIEKDIPNQYKQ